MTQIWGIGTTRNEADIIGVNVLHHLAQGIDRFLFIDNGSDDGTFEVLRELARSMPVEWSSHVGHFRQKDLLTDLARQAFVRGADWVIPIDADEFWCAPGSTIRAVLEGSSAGSLRVQLINFVQHRTQVNRTADGLLTMTARPPAPVGPIERIAERVESKEIGYVEILYPGKWIARTHAGLQIGWGNHYLIDATPPAEETSAIVCLHAPLRSKSVLQAKVDAHRPSQDLKEYLEVAWHVRRWRRIALEGGLDAEWQANSHQNGFLEVGGHKRPVVTDYRLHDLVARWLRPEASASSISPSVLTLASERSRRQHRAVERPRVWGVSVVRNEADIIRRTILHHLGLGLEKIIVADNGSTDGTTDILAKMSAEDPRIEWRRLPGSFQQTRIINALAREVFLGGGTWVLPFDADEFWLCQDTDLPSLLERTEAGALGCEVVNFVQRRDQLHRSDADFSHLVFRPARPIGTVEQARELVESRAIACVEASAHPPKWISRARPDLAIAQGNHWVNGVGRIERTDQLVCLHAPLRSRAVLFAQAEHGLRLECLGLPSGAGWHVRRWYRMSDDSELLEQEWRANSYDGDALDVYGSHHRLVQDFRLRDALDRIRDTETSQTERTEHPPPIVSSAAEPAAVECSNRRSLLAPLDRASLWASVDKIPGWLAREEVELLFDVVAIAATQPGGVKTFVEIGSYQGRSTVAMASVLRAVQSPGTVFAIDPHQGYVGAVDSPVGFEAKPTTFELFTHHLRERGLSDFVELIQRSSWQVAWNRPIGLLFVDGLHDRVSVRQDLERFTPWVVGGGFVLCHDYLIDFPGVTEAVDELVRSGEFVKFAQAGSLIALRRAALRELTIEEATMPLNSPSGVQPSTGAVLSPAIVRENELAAAWHQIAGLENEVARHRLEIARRTGAITGLEERVARHQQMTNALTAQLEQFHTETANLRAQLTEARHHLEISSTEAAGLRAQLTDARHQLEIGVTETAGLRAQLTDARHHLEISSTETGRLRAQLTDARDYMEFFSAETADLRSQLIDARHVLEISSTETADLRAQLTDARHRLEINSTETANLRAQLTDALHRLQMISVSTSWRLTLPVRRFAEGFPWFSRQLKQVLKFLAFQMDWRMRFQMRRNIRLLASSKFFDGQWYLGQYPDVQISGVDPALHYLEHGASEGRDPSPLFNTDWYLQQNSDVRKAGTNPLVHYLKHGAAEGRHPTPVIQE